MNKTTPTRANMVVLKQIFNLIPSGLNTPPTPGPQQVVVWPMAATRSILFRQEQGR